MSTAPHYSCARRPHIPVHLSCLHSDCAAHSVLGSGNKHTCDDIVDGAHGEQQVPDEAHLGAGVHVAQAPAQHGGERGPHLGLGGGGAAPQQVQHAQHAVRLLDQVVRLQVELTPHQLEGETRGRGVGRESDREREREREPES